MHKKRLFNFEIKNAVVPLLIINVVFFMLQMIIGRGFTVNLMLVTHDIGVISRNVKSVACVNRTMLFHEEGKITLEMIDMAYQCPVDLVAHGIPHRVLPDHEEK